MHRFPADPKRFKVWEERMNRRNWKAKPTTFLCVAHFDKECFIRDPEICKRIKMKILLKEVDVSCLLPIHSDISDPVQLLQLYQKPVYDS